jgi:pyruvate ferredoxin oxidoreductase alpha subunit
MKMMEGSKAFADTVKVCRPQVISAYPITPQTHIVEELSKIVADGELKTEYVRVESEHSAASVCLGASTAGVRTFTATTSQGLLLMIEVLYNIAGMRLPVVLMCANRAVSAPLNIWNDHQDSISVRDAGWIQLYAEDIQEGIDMVLQAYKIAEHPDVRLPVMIGVDGFILTHTSEPVELIDQAMADKYLPPYRPEIHLDVKKPMTIGAFADPESYMEIRYSLHRAVEESKKVIREVAAGFRDMFGRFGGDLIETYSIEGAETVVVAMGSIITTCKELSDEMNSQGRKMGVLKVRCHRPFPDEEIYDALKDAQNVIVLEKAVSLGQGGILGTEIRSLFMEMEDPPRFSNFILGLGGRDVPKDFLEMLIIEAEESPVPFKFVGLKEELLGGGK